MHCAELFASHSLYLPPTVVHEIKFGDIDCHVNINNLPFSVESVLDKSRDT